MQRPDRSYIPASNFPDEGAPIRQLMWEDINHGRLLTTIYGSVWPRVFPYCIANVIICLAVYELKLHDIADLTFSPSGHQYMSMLMSFLVVMRTKITYQHYMEASKLLSNSYRACRELVQLACLLTAQDQSDSAKQWRQDVSYSTILMLRVTMAVLEMPSHPTMDPWNVPELSYEHQHYIKNLSMWHNPTPVVPGNVATEAADSNATSAATTSVSLPLVSPQARLEDAFRVPTVLAFLLRKEILKQRDGTWLQAGLLKHPCNEEMQMLDQVAAFLKCVGGLQKLVTTKFPFPLVQMTKTFLFLWVFTLSCALNNAQYQQPFLVMLLVFLTTFGFLGLEFVSMELSDMFGEDPCDFDNLGFAQICFEDQYIAIYKLDGQEWACKLRERVMGRLATTAAKERFREQSQQDLRRERSSGEYFGTPQNSLRDMNALTPNLQQDVGHNSSQSSGWFF